MRPLPPGTILAARFTVQSVLGRGGFSYAYAGVDQARGDAVVIKELAPEGATRRADGTLDLGDDAHRIRQRFLDEAQTLGKLNVRGVLPVRLAFGEYGTAYFVTDRLPGASTLDELIRQNGPMDVDGALDLFLQLLETVDDVHQRGLLHRDIKPSNVLVTPEGQAYLIDFGSAREWAADTQITHTVMFTPGYAPPEQLSERGRRGPASDVYGLAATLYHMLAGRAPESATDRIAGVELTPIETLRPGIEPAVSAAIDAGLRLKMADRPQSVDELRDRMGSPPEVAPVLDLAALDDLLMRSREFRYDRRACPACEGLLQLVRPLPKQTCPVCRKGRIEARPIDRRLCPICRNGRLTDHSNVDPLFVCPACGKDKLVYRRKGLISRERTAECTGCSGRFDVNEGALERADVEPHEEHTIEDWRLISGRGERLWTCAACDAQLDELADGRQRQVFPVPPRPVERFPEEWALIAAGFKPTSGDAECAACGAEYDLDGDSVTLIGAPEDPFGFAKEHRGRRMRLEETRWLAVGKWSPTSGWVCDRCPIEFDAVGDLLALVHSDNRRLARHTDEVMTIEDWHRVARGLPLAGQDGVIQTRLEDAIRAAYRRGEIGVDGPQIAWSGPAVRAGDRSAKTLTVREDAIEYGGLLRRERLTRESLLESQALGDDLWLAFDDESEITFTLEPTELVVRLRSGEHSVLLTAADLAARLGPVAIEPASPER